MEKKWPPLALLGTMILQRTPNAVPPMLPNDAVYTSAVIKKTKSALVPLVIMLPNYYGNFFSLKKNAIDKDDPDSS